MCAKTKNNTPNRFLYGVLAIVVITFIAYLPALSAGFIWDDTQFLLENPVIKAPDGLYHIWFSTKSPDYFPLVSSSLWLEWRLWGDNPIGYHFINILLHAIGTVILWRILKLLNIPAAFFAAIIFAVHPVNVESVAWITERKNTLPMPFYLLSILFFVRYYDETRFKWYAISLLMFLLSLLGKPIAAMMPFILIGFVWWRKGGFSVKDLLRTLPFFALSGLFSLITIWFQYNRAIGKEIIRNDGFLSRLVIAAHAIWFYLYKALIPYNLIYVYPRWNIDPKAIISWLPLVALLVAFVIFWLYRKSWAKPFLFGFGYYVIMLFPVLGFFNIFFMQYSFVADHWQYVAIPAVIILLAALSNNAFNRLKLTYQKVIVAIAVTCLLAVLTFRQARIYDNLEILWYDTIAKNPNCWMAHNNLGTYFAQKGKNNEAEEHFVKTIQLNPTYAKAYANLGIIWGTKGKVNEAIACYKKAMELAPDYAGTYYNWGNLLLLLGDPNQAAMLLEKAVRISPKLAKAHYLLGYAYHLQGDMDKAVNCYNTSLNLDKKNAEAWSKRGMIMIAQSKIPEAVNDLRTALRLKPDSPETLNALAVILAVATDAKIRNPFEAVQLAQKACRLTDFKEAILMDTLAIAYDSAGMSAEAINTAQKALQLAEIHNQPAIEKTIREHLESYKSHKTDSGSE